MVKCNTSSTSIFIPWEGGKISTTATNDKSQEFNNYIIVISIMHYKSYKRKNFIYIKLQTIMSSMNEYEIKVNTETSGPAPRSNDDFTLVMPDGQKTILKIRSNTKLGGLKSDSLMKKVREAVKDDKGIKITKVF